MHQETIQENEPQAEPSWDLLQEMVDQVNHGRGRMYGSDVILLMNALDAETLDYCSNDFQQRFFERMVAMDPEETLVYWSLYSYRPYGPAILRKAALRDPEKALESVEMHADLPEFRALHSFLRKQLDDEKLKLIEKERRSGLFRWLYLKLLKGDKDTPEKHLD